MLWQRWNFFSFNTFPYSICFLFAVKSRDFDARSLLLLGADEPLAARRAPSPSRTPRSCMLHVRNLVRPFTVPQLKMILSRNGSIVEENGLIVNNIKSHCIVIVRTHQLPPPLLPFSTQHFNKCFCICTIRLIFL